MCKYAVNYYQINCPLCFLLILIKMDTPDQAGDFKNDTSNYFPLMLK